MTKVIFYADSNNIRKNADCFVKTGDYTALAKELTNDSIVLADNPDDGFLKSLEAEYGVRIAKASLVRDGLSRDEEALVAAYKSDGMSSFEISKATGFSIIDILESEAINGSDYRFAKVMR